MKTISEVRARGNLAAFDYVFTWLDLARDAAEGEAVIRRIDHAKRDLEDLRRRLIEDYVAPVAVARIEAESVS